MITWLASYPRSGSTFFRVLLKECLAADTSSVYNDSDISANRELAELTGHVNLAAGLEERGFSLSHLRQSSENVFVKTHEATPELMAPGDRVIYIVRDGREASVSYRHYQGDIREHQVSVESIILGLGFPWCSWGEHAQGWLDAAPPSDLLVVRFEDLVTRPGDMVTATADFTGLEIRARALPDFTSLQKVDARFFRRGATDSWKASLDERAQLLFALINAPTMQRLAYDRDIPPGFSSLDPGLVELLRETLLATAHELRQAMRALEESAKTGQTDVGSEGREPPRELVERLVSGLDELASRQRAIENDYPAAFVKKTD